MSGTAAAKAEAGKTPEAQDKAHQTAPDADVPAWQAPGGVSAPVPGNSALATMLRNRAVPPASGLAHVASSVRGGGARAVADLISGTPQRPTGADLTVSCAEQRTGQPLDGQTRSAFESVFARTRIAERHSIATEQETANGHPVSTPASVAEREADRVSAAIDTGAQPDIAGSDRPDFSDVRVHADDEAARAALSLHANAFTLGSHIFFGPGQLDVSSSKGRRLLAHELTHVVQAGQQRGDQQITKQATVFRESWGDKASKWYDEKKWAVYRAMIAGLKTAKNAAVSLMRGQLPKAPVSLQPALATIVDVVDFVVDMLIALLLVIIGIAVGFAEGIVSLVTGIIKLLYGLLKLIADWVVAVLGKPDAYTQDVNALVAAMKGIPEGLKKTIDDWVERYKKATLEEQVLMGGELIGQIEAFIATFAVAGTKAGQATSITVRAPQALTALKVGSEGAAALEPARAITITIPKVVPETVAEGAAVASQMSAMSSGGQGGVGGGGGGGSSTKDAPKPIPEAENGPYKDIKDGTLVKPGREFTQTQKRKIIEANRQRNGGRLRSDDPLDTYPDLSDPVRSVSPGMGGAPQDPAMAAIDHIVSQAAGGTNSYGNARVISQHWNNILRAKGAVKAR